MTESLLQLLGSYEQGKTMRILLILALWQLPLLSYAEKYTGEVNPKRATTAEMKRLPEFCQLRFKWGYGGKQFSNWKKTLGPESLHIHHYCEGLVDLMRIAKKEKHWKSTLNSAKSNFNYVLTRVQNPRFILLPDLYYRQAIVSMEEGNTGEAINNANKSIQAKQNYLNPYILISDIYISTGNKREAKEILLQAQQYHPNSKKLKRKLKEIK